MNAVDAQPSRRIGHRLTAWHSPNCRTCSKPAFISATRPAGGTRRCGASSSPSARASTSSISRRPSARSQKAQELLRSVVLKGEGVLFVCTKKQLKAIVQAEAADLRRVLRHRALARRHAHQLPDAQEADPAPAGAGAGRGRRRLRELHQEGKAALRARAGEAEPQPRGHQADGPAARRAVHRGRQEGEDRRRRGQQARASRSSPSWTPTPIPTSSPCRCPATTTPSARSR